ncbi:FadR/GntR family transcriptional regulator [Vibrio sp.]|uniref:FadR/GntR family transcriptional regulator n=1 Tax=Vibrio sp. TaxID=678 RepID=UPI003AA9CAC9
MHEINKTSIQEHVTQAVRMYINERDLKRGDKLPSQVEMVSMLGVSRTSLREALKKLEAFDVIEVKKGKGVYVKDPSSDPDSWKERERKVVLQALELRKVLEREIIKLLVESASDDELDIIEGYLEGAIEKHAKGEEQNYEDRMFHQSIYKYCHNPLMMHVIDSVSNIFELFWSHPLDIPTPFMDTIPLHKKTFDMIREKNIEKAQMYNDMAIDVVIKEVTSYQRVGS